MRAKYAQKLYLNNTRAHVPTPILPRPLLPIGLHFIIFDLLFPSTKTGCGKCIVWLMKNGYVWVIQATEQ